MRRVLASGIETSQSETRNYQNMTIASSLPVLPEATDKLFLQCIRSFMSRTQGESGYKLLISQMKLSDLKQNLFSKLFSYFFLTAKDPREARL